MSSTKIPGVKGVHRLITHKCLAMKGLEGSVDEAVEDARKFLMEVIPRWEKQPGTKFHVVVVVEREDD